MVICVIGKYPPTEGGVSAQTYWTCHLLARAGHTVFVVTNADETEPEHRIWFLPTDTDRMGREYPSGGSVRVSFVQPYHDADLYYIPNGRPTITRLASVAAELVRRHRCEVVLGWYLEPYGIAASLVGAWTGTPFLIRHAGSDLFDLAAQPELGPAYREVFRAAAGVLTLAAPAESFGVPPGRVFRLPGLFLPEEFNPYGDRLDIAVTATYLAGRGSRFVTRTDAPPTELPLIGSYGKLGASKGTVDLVHAVARARAAGTEVGLVLVGGGRGWPTVINAVHEAGIADVTWTLPMLAPWRIPSLIRTCRALAYLERDFEVVQHRPTPPIEILACGRPLLLSSQAREAVLPGRAPDDPLWSAVEAADPHAADLLAQAVGAVLARSGVPREALAGALSSEAEVTGWFAEVFQAVLQRHGAAGRRPTPTTTPAEVEHQLAAHCPVALRLTGGRLRPRMAAAALTSPNALFAAFSVVDPELVALRAQADDENDARRSEAQRAIAEHHALWTRVDVEGLGGIPAFTAPVCRVPDLTTADRDQLAALHPVACTWLRLAEFDVDVLGHLRTLSPGSATTLHADRRREHPDRGQRHVLLFHKTPNLARMIARVGPTVREFLTSADGTRSLADHVEQLRVDPNRLAAFVRLVAALQRAGVVLFRRDHDFG